MDETLPKYFGLTIAFLIPGFLGVYTLSFFAPPVADWLGLAANQDVQLGGFLFALIAAIGFGVSISGLRCLVLDWAMPKSQPLDYKRLGEVEVDRLLEFARVHHYQFYQFYSNTLCALVLVFGAWWWTADPRPARIVVGQRFGMLVAMGVVLFFSARDCWRKFDKKVEPTLALPKRGHRT